MNVITGNYGNQTIALMQWVHEQQMKDVYVMTVETGWAADRWQKRVKAGESYAKKCGFNVVRLQSKPSFQELMRERKEFPSQKFQWCAGFLKGLAFLDWLETLDPGCEATMLIGKRRAESRANFDLPEIVEESEHYEGRKVWYPLIELSDDNFDNLIKKAGFEILNHRSLECDPCVNSDRCDLLRLSEATINKTEKLEKEIKKTMFEKPIREMIKMAQESNEICHNSSELFDMGCGLPFACGE